MKKRIVRMMTRHLGSALSFVRKSTLATAGIAVIAAPLLLGLLKPAQVRAQSSTVADPSNKGVAGTWQGILHSETDRRLVFVVTWAPGPAYKADFFDLDQGAQTRVSHVASDKGVVAMNLAVIGAAYTGKLSPNGNTITGDWLQGSRRLPLELTRATPSTAWELPPPPSLPPMMDANATPTLEVATIKPSKPEAPVKSFRMIGPRLQVTNSNLNDMIVFAYGVHPKQVAGAPAWAETDKFDIEAKPNGEGVPTINQWRMMMRQLLTERCKLASHNEQRPLSVYLLIKSEGGSKLTRSGGDPNGRVGLSFRGRLGGDVSAYNATIGDFINFMTRYVQLDRPIIDKTGILGRYDFTLDWTPDESQFGGKAIPPAEGAATPPSLYTAIQEQLGLKLDATKTLAEVLVIDHVERPSEN
jgi:uncharacterized protein (TIGR03435 family)